MAEVEAKRLGQIQGELEGRLEELARMIEGDSDEIASLKRGIEQVEDRIAAMRIEGEAIERALAGLKGVDGGESPS